MKSGFLRKWGTLAAVIVVMVVVRSFLAIPRKPNVIMVTLDALRADYLGCYGFGENTSPEIDAFSRDAVIFTQAISASSHTAPANASLVSSSYPAVHGITKEWQENMEFPADMPVLSQIVHGKGYSTALVTDQLSLSLISGFVRGFDSLDFLPPALYEGRAKGFDITGWAISWLKRHKQKQFFLWLYYLDPHNPYTPVYPYNTLFRHALPDQEKSPSMSFCSEVNNTMLLGCLPDFVRTGDCRDVNFYVSQYCGEIRQTDSQLGRLFAFLKESSLARNTIVIVMSDHGEAMGEHDQYFRHSTYLYDNLVKIPLIIKNPYVSSGVKKVTHQVRSIDIAPTILDFLSIPVPPSMQGRSLRPFLEGHSVPDFPEYALSEWRDRVSVRTRDWKLIYNGSDGSYELYDIAHDPGELVNVSQAHKEQFDLLKTKLEEYANLRRARRPEKGMEAMSAQKKEILKSLGYMQ